MRLVHLADLHLGFRQYHRLNQLGINQREADVALAFRRVMDRVIALRPDAVVIAGDVFHSVRPMNPAIIDAYIQFRRLRESVPDAAIVMVAGNHDRPRSTETGCILRLFKHLGIHVVDAGAERLVFPEHDLAVLAVPDISGPPPALVPEGPQRHQVLLLHGEVEGMLPDRVQRGDHASVEISKEELGAPRWSYVALGHYHVYRSIAPNAYYAGSLDYTSANPWGELDEERAAGIPGKGFIEVDLATGEHQFHAADLGRRLIDLAPLSAAGLSPAEVDAAIRERVERVEGGIDDRIVRLVIREIPRNVARQLDHQMLRELKRRALNFHLDLRRPEPRRLSMSGSPGRRPTLPEIVQAHLMSRPLDASVDREALIRLGLRYLHEAEAGEQAAGALAVPVAGG